MNHDHEHYHQPQSGRRWWLTRNGKLAVTGLYARIRHPQYLGFVAILFGFLLQWPTILTVVMFPILLFMHWRLAINEKTECRKRFGRAWEDYASQVIANIPNFSNPSLRHE